MGNGGGKTHSTAKQKSPKQKQNAKAKAPRTAGELDKATMRGKPKA